ncbi:MAG: hypothetical protein P4L96_03950 [Rhodoferax sp.]|nr:hypothetical protein [Rhodoferax sp.]
MALPAAESTINAMPLPLANLPAQRVRRRFIGADTHGSHAIDAPAAIRLWHLASLDAPTVAVVWTLSLARAADVRLPAWVPVLLALGVWSVYIGDRLLDARSAMSRCNLASLRERHFFHWRHRRTLLPAALAAACVCAALVFTQMPIAFRERNSALAAAALAYFSGVHLPRRPRRFSPLVSKELLVGVLFAAGCALPTLTRVSPGNLCSTAAVSLVFAALAWLNCHSIDRWESAPHAHIAPKAFVLTAAAVIAACTLAVARPRAAELLVAAALSAMLLALLDRGRARLTPLALRAAADVVLLTPLALLLR